MKVVCRIIVLALITEIAFLLCDTHVDDKLVYFIGVIAGCMLYHYIMQTFAEYIFKHMTVTEIRKEDLLNKKQGTDKDN